MGSYPHRHNNAAPIYELDGKLWVTHADLLDNEYESLEDFSIVYLNGKFYELQGYVNKPDAWWIEEVETDNVTPDSLETS